ncbi:MAG: hypothetical protein WCK75_10220 [Elusimicrobiota bacterium]
MKNPLKNSLRVTCLLALPALLLFARPCQAEQSGFISVRETVALQDDGSALVRSVATVGKPGPGPLMLPFSYKAAEELRVTLGEKGAVVPARLEEIEGVKYLRLEAGAQDLRGAELTATFRVPGYLDWKKAGPGEYGYYKWKSQYFNTTRRPIDSVTLEIILPPGFIAAAFGKSVPAPAKEEALPPYSVKNMDGRSHLFMRAEVLTIGKACSLEYSFAARKRSLWLPLAAALAALLYLVFFKDLVAGV